MDNVVLICVDQWRGDCLSAAGHPVVRTPYLDALARRGTRFSRAYSAVPTCVPARATLHTGLSQVRTGRLGYQDGVPWRYPVTLAGEFGRAGHQTRMIGKLHAYPERNRVGFDETTLHDGYLHFSRGRQRDPRSYDDYLTWLERQPGQRPGSDYFDHGVNCNSVVARPWDRAEALHPTSWVVTEAIDFLYRRDPTVPFFLNLSFHRPHPPYDPPAWAFEQYLSAPPYEPVRGDWTAMLEPWRDDLCPDAFVARYDETTRQRARAGYFGHMAHLDQQISRFLEVLKEFGEAGRTWICFVSDHGEMLGEHDLWRKGYGYEGSAHVPLLLAAPEGRDDLPGGVVSDAVVELRDVMPTLLAAAGVPVPDGLDGRDLLPLARGEDAPVRGHLHGEHIVLDQSQQWIVDAGHKYLWWSETGTEQLFDLTADPQETRDLAGDPAHARELARLRACLVDALTGRPEGFVCDGALVAGRPVTRLLPAALAGEGTA